METKDQKEEEKGQMRSKILSIPGGAASDALKKLQEKNISCQFIGIDSTSDKILMRAEYLPEQENTVQDAIKGVIEYEKANESLVSLVKDVLKEFKRAWD